MMGQTINSFAPCLFSFICMGSPQLINCLEKIRRCGFIALGVGLMEDVCYCQCEWRHKPCVSFSLPVNQVEKLPSSAPV